MRVIAGQSLSDLCHSPLGYFRAFDSGYGGQDDESNGREHVLTPRGFRISLVLDAQGIEVGVDTGPDELPQSLVPATGVPGGVRLANVLVDLSGLSQPVVR